jgi:hypothetical protein
MSLRRYRHNEHYVAFTVRPASPSRRALTITVTQMQDDAGHWLLPTITISESIPQITEDVTFMRTVAEALAMACLEFMDMMDNIT